MHSPVKHRRNVSYVTYILFITIPWLLSACTVTNNLGFHSAHPAGEGNGNGLIGIGAGITPKIDSTTNDGAYAFSQKHKLSPFASLGMNYGLTEKVNLRMALHFTGGGGFRLGAQYSFFPSESMVNLAVGTDISASVAKESFRWFWSEHDVWRSYSRDSYGLSVFAPLGIKISEDLTLTFTPKWSYYEFNMLRYKYQDDEYTYQIMPVSLSIGVWFKQGSAPMYGEMSYNRIGNTVMPTFGVALLGLME